MNTLTKTQTLLLAVLTVCCLGLFAETTNAQTQQAPTESVNITTESRFYGPNESVTVNLSSNLINLTNADITWTQDGETIASGVGTVETSVTTGAVGETTEVGVRAQIPSRGIITRSLELTPVDVDLIWEAVDSFVPAFYQGKALHSGWGPVKVTVIPHIPKNNQSGGRFSANELVYSWKFNNLVYGDDSGRGENTFTFDGTPRSNRVSVEIETPGGEPVAARSVTIPTTEPQINLYPVSETRGVVLPQLLTDTTTDISGTGISAKPFYYLADAPQNDNLEYDWRINNRTLDRPADINQVQFRNDLFSSNENSVSLEINDNSHLLFPSVNTDQRISL